MQYDLARRDILGVQSANKRSEGWVSSAGRSARRSDAPFPKPATHRDSHYHSLLAYRSPWQMLSEEHLPAPSSMIFGSSASLWRDQASVATSQESHAGRYPRKRRKRWGSWCVVHLTLLGCSQKNSMCSTSSWLAAFDRMEAGLTKEGDRS